MSGEASPGRGQCGQLYLMYTNTLEDAKPAHGGPMRAIARATQKAPGRANARYAHPKTFNPPGLETVF